MTITVVYRSTVIVLRSLTIVLQTIKSLNFINKYVKCFLLCNTKYLQLLTITNDADMPFFVPLLCYFWEIYWIKRCKRCLQCVPDTGTKVYRFSILFPSTCRSFFSTSTLQRYFPSTTQKYSGFAILFPILTQKVLFDYTFETYLDVCNIHIYVDIYNGKYRPRVYPNDINI